MTELTGKHVLAITVGAFAVIIGVNLTLAFKAVSTFPGLEVENSYVASQGFNARKAAQEALGWTMTPAYDQGRMTLAFLGADGQPVQVNDLQVLVGRTTETTNDTFPAFTRVGDLYAADLPLNPGKWMVKVTATSPDGTLFEQRSELFVKG
ncbi:FixH family protein [Rhodobacter calidifons]|uniref:FixH family protein n=1 Tax=Rhodobacter calidifons TaxID=2715277 RepID=A0ABX0G4W5_9RHOB|nr:FixH family protein [Rhodobacter calidifons]NHB76239.1 FixH family protein [Rhodobacter calidifons]